MIYRESVVPISTNMICLHCNRPIVNSFHVRIHPIQIQVILSYPNPSLNFQPSPNKKYCVRSIFSTFESCGFEGGDWARWDRRGDHSAYVMDGGGASGPIVGIQLESVFERPDRVVAFPISVGAPGYQPARSLPESRYQENSS